MKYVFVIEDEQRFQKDLFEALTLVDPKLTVRFFENFESFNSFLENLSNSEAALVHSVGTPYFGDPQIQAVNPTEDANLALLIWKDELVGHQHLDLLQKARDLFIDKKLCTIEDPTAFVVTAFDKPEFKIKTVEKDFIYNVLFKPFDVLILQQSLLTALAGRHPFKSSLVHTMKTTVEVEMIKNVDTESFSDVGFITRSPRPIAIGQRTKYYGDLFTGSKINFIYARCWKCEQHPEFKEEYRCWFTFFGSESVSHSEFRRKLVLLKAPEIKIRKEDSAATQNHIALIEGNVIKRKELKTALEKNFKSIQVVEFSHWDDFAMRIDPLTFEANQKAESWSGEETLSLTLETTGHNITAFDPPLPEGKKFLGLTTAEAYAADFLKMIPEVSQPSWLKHFVSKKTAPGIDSIFQINSAHGKFLVKCTQISEVRSDQNLLTGLKFVFQKPSIDEKKNWHNKMTVLKEPIDLIFSQAEHINRQDPKSWAGILELLQKKSGKEVTVIALTENTADDSIFRTLPSWVHDIYFHQLDRIELMRKVALFLSKPSDESFKFFDVKQEIRVANPVALTQLSETHLVMKYHRPMSYGSYRRIVLPKVTVGEAMLEYLATCNFSEPDPSDKNIHLNYFVFFGIRDLYLKNIRVWIRDNYALEKGKAAG